MKQCATDELTSQGLTNKLHMWLSWSAQRGSAIVGSGCSCFCGLWVTILLSVHVGFGDQIWVFTFVFWQCYRINCTGIECCAVVSKVVTVLVGWVCLCVWDFFHFEVVVIPLGFNYIERHLSRYDISSSCSCYLSCWYLSSSFGCFTELICCRIFALVVSVGLLWCCLPQCCFVLSWLLRDGNGSGSVHCCAYFSPVMMCQTEGGLFDFVQ